MASDGVLSGIWIGDDRAVYYVHHEAGVIWWAGLSADSVMGAEEFHLGLRFANLFRGRTIGSAIIGEWVDTPRGDVPQGGTLDLSIVSADEIRRLREGGGFGCSVWRRADAVPVMDVPSMLADLFRARGPHDPGFDVCVECGVAEGVVVRNLVADGDDLGFAVRVDRQLWSTSVARADTPESERATAAIARQDNILECTILGRTGSSGLPGWTQRDGASVLFPAGRPVNGYVSVAPDGSARIFGRDIPPGTRVRVSGCLTMRNDVSGHSEPVSLCPVYSIDIVDPVARGTLSGIWSAHDRGTYYLRQVGNTIWWLGMSHNQGQSFTNVFHGMIVPDGTDNIIHGELVDVPRGTRRDTTPLTLRISDPTTLIAVDGAFGRWTKMSG